MDTPQVSPVVPTSIQNNSFDQYESRSAKKNKFKLFVGFSSLGIITLVSFVTFFFIRNRNTENRSQAALETTAPVITAGKDGCFATVQTQGTLLFWQDTCQGRAATEAIALPTSTNTATMALVDTTTRVQQTAALTSGTMLSPTGMEKYTLAINAPTNAQSVGMELNGVIHRIDSERPFTLTREEGTGYLPLNQLESLTAGTNFLKLIYYPEKEGTGTPIKQETLVFSAQTRGTDKQCTRTSIPLFPAEQEKYKQWVASGRPLQAGCPAPQAAIASTTVLPVLGCNSTCVADSDCNGSVITLVNKRPVGAANASVIESITVNGATIEEDAKAITYRGVWYPYVNPTFYSGKAIMYSVAADASVSFYATGNTVAVTTDTGPNRIGFDVYADGVKLTNTGLENLTVAGNGNVNDLTNYKLKTVAFGIPGKPAIYGCSDVSGSKMCRIKNNPSDASCVIPVGTNTTITPPSASVTVAPICNATCTAESTCDEVTVRLVPKYASAAIKYAVIDKITVGDFVRQETDASLTYAGSWFPYGPAAGYMDGVSTIKYAGATNAAGTPAVSFKVNGPNFTIRTDKGFNRSGFDVYIDDVKLPPTALDNLYQAGTTYTTFETTISVPGYDANKYTCATVGTGKVCRLTSKTASLTCTT